MRKVIVNTTPIIALAEIDRLDLLHKLYGEITIPNAVFEEILSEPAKSMVTACGWIHVERVQDDSSKVMYKARLHAGEVEVMILALEKQADLVIIDDNAAKKTAKYLGLKVTGTLGVLLKAKKDGIIGTVGPIMSELISNGLFIGDEVKKYVLKQAGE